MVTENKAQIAAEAPAKVAETVADTTAKVAAETGKTAKRARVASARRAKRNVKVAAKATTQTRRAKSPRRATRTTAPKAAAATERKTNVNFDAVNWMNNLGSFTAVPGAERFQTLYAEAGERGQAALQRSTKVAEEIVEIARGNVEALVETGRIAASGARSLGQDAVARTREGIEQASQQVKTLVDAKSPTEFFQLQSELARAQFDRMVADTSRLTESLVKLAGEAIQPISNRTALNAQRLNDITA